MGRDCSASGKQERQCGQELVERQYQQTEEKSLVAKQYETLWKSTSLGPYDGAAITTLRVWGPRTSQRTCQCTHTSLPVPKPMVVAARYVTDSRYAGSLEFRSLRSESDSPCATVDARGLQTWGTATVFRVI